MANDQAKSPDEDRGEPRDLIARPPGPVVSARRSPNRWVVFYAFLIAVARFIPVPLLDDWVPVRLRQLMVHSLLREAGRPYATRQVAALYRDGGCLASCLGLVLLLPLKLIIYPVRKIVAVVRAVRGLSQSVVETFLLGWTIERCLAQGLLASDASPLALAQEAGLIRLAFDRALASSNPALFASPLAAAWKGLGGLWLAGARLAYRVARTPQPNVTDAEVNSAEGSAERARAETNATEQFDGAAEGEAAASQQPSTNPPGFGLPDNPRVNAALGIFHRLLLQREIRAFVHDFDERFEQTLTRCRAEQRERELAAQSERAGTDSHTPRT